MIELVGFDGDDLVAPGGIDLDIADFVCLGIGGWLGGKPVYSYGPGRGEANQKSN